MSPSPWCRQVYVGHEYKSKERKNVTGGGKGVRGGQGETAVRGGAGLFGVSPCHVEISRMCSVLPGPVHFGKTARFRRVRAARECGMGWDGGRRGGGGLGRGMRLERENCVCFTHGELRAPMPCISTSRVHGKGSIHLPQRYLAVWKLFVLLLAVKKGIYRWCSPLTNTLPFFLYIGKFSFS